MPLERSVYQSVSLFSSESCEDLFPEDSSCDRLTFYHFDISRLLKHGASLLGSAGAEFEVQDDKTGLRSFFFVCFFFLSLSSITLPHVPLVDVRRKGFQVVLLQPSF